MTNRKPTPEELTPAPAAEPEPITATPTDVLTAELYEHVQGFGYAEAALAEFERRLADLARQRDALLAALKACLLHPGLDECDLDQASFGTEPICDTIRQARAAIAATTEGGAR